MPRETIEEKMEAISKHCAANGTHLTFGGRITIGERVPVQDNEPQTRKLH